MKYAKSTDMVGETLTHIDVFPEDKNNQDEILFTCASGRKFLFTHVQDCCEHVRIQDQRGEWSQLIGKQLRNVTKKEEVIDKKYVREKKTEFTFIVDDATVVSLWHGESNGFYSEYVDIKEIFEEER